jgi:hypothetical protein
MSLKDLLTGGLFDKAAEAFKARAESRNIERTLEAKIAEQTLNNEAQIELNRQEWELLHKWSEEGTWRDEYITVSVVAIWNCVVIGAIAAAFGYPQVLEGIKSAVLTLNEIGVNVGLIMEVTIFAGLGIYAWNKWK